MEEAIDREALTVRRSVGIVDVSTLGKFDIQGPDAAAFLDRIYANPIASMKVGACRYGLMLREDGFLLDDGTVSRLSDANWYITSSTGRASAVHAHLEYYAQTVWNDLEVYITDLTDQFAAIAIAGPNSRDVLGKLFGPDKVSNEALPHMSVGQLDFDGTPVRILRMSFSGERAYELHVPARHAERLWRELAASGAAYGLAPYGTEAMNVLRIEKGHIAGNEIDGRTLVSDFDLERMMKKKGYFVGKRLLERPGLDGTIARRKIVGLMSRDGQPIPRGAQLIESPTRDRPARAIGHVSSTCHSPHLNASIALALILDRDQWLGKTVRAVCDLTSASVPVEVVGSVFIDPEGAKCRD
jgi:glycine cleavage system aminomethyltransferase T